MCVEENPLHREGLRSRLGRFQFFLFFVRDERSSVSENAEIFEYFQKWWRSERTRTPPPCDSFLWFFFVSIKFFDFFNFLRFLIFRFVKFIFVSVFGWIFSFFIFENFWNEFPVSKLRHRRFTRICIRNDLASLLPRDKFDEKNVKQLTERAKKGDEREVEVCKSFSGFCGEKVVLEEPTDECLSGSCMERKLFPPQRRRSFSASARRFFLQAKKSEQEERKKSSSSAFPSKLKVSEKVKITKKMCKGKEREKLKSKLFSFFGFKNTPQGQLRLKQLQGGSRQSNPFTPVLDRAEASVNISLEKQQNSIFFPTDKNREKKSRGAHSSLCSQLISCAFTNTFLHSPTDFLYFSSLVMRSKKKPRKDFSHLESVAMCEKF